MLRVTAERLQVIGRAPIVRRQDERSISAQRNPWLLKVVEGKLTLNDLYRWCTSGQEEPANSTSLMASILRRVSYKTVNALCNIFVLLFPILQERFPSRGEVSSYECADVWPTVTWCIYIGIFSLDIVISAAAFATVNEPLYYIWPVVRTQGGHTAVRVSWQHIVHCVDILFVVILVSAVVRRQLGFGLEEDLV